MHPLRFNQLMAQLTATVGKPFSDDEIEAWYEHLRDVPAAALELAFSRACKECEAFPSVALLRRLASESQHGEVAVIPDVWPNVLKAVRRFGIYGKADAKKAIPADVWRCIGGDVGWEWLCDMEPDQRAAFAAQFRDRYRELKAREERDRRLPEHLRPRIDNTPVRGLPDAEPEPLALPSPEPPTTEQIDAARLKVFRETPEPEPVNEATLEARRASQIAAAKRLAGAS